MRDKERISRLLGAALQECSGSSMDAVRLHVVRAMNALDSVAERKHPTPVANQPRAYAPMTKEQQSKALEDIQDMIDEEKSKIESPKGGAKTLLG